MTHREATRFQSFPDDFQFCGNKVEVARQIGNAVAPRLAYQVAQTVLRHLHHHRPEAVGGSRRRLPKQRGSLGGRHAEQAHLTKETQRQLAASLRCEGTR